MSIVNIKYMLFDYLCNRPYIEISFCMSFILPLHGIYIFKYLKTQTSFQQQQKQENKISETCEQAK